MEKLKPEKLVEMLKKDGIDVSIDQAISILKFLRMLADIVVADHLKKAGHNNRDNPYQNNLQDEDSGLIHQGEHRRAS